jgi:hypothetical protein
MNEHASTRRIIIAIIGAGLAILLAFAVYIFWPGASNIRATDAANSAENATKSADDAVAAAGMSPAQRKATEALVRAYILENPEIITDAVAILQQRDVAKRLAAAGNQIAKAFPGAEAGNPKGDVTIVEFTDYNANCLSSANRAGMRRYGRLQPRAKASTRHFTMHCFPVAALTQRT